MLGIGSGFFSTADLKSVLVEETSGLSTEWIVGIGFWFEKGFWDSFGEHDDVFAGNRG